MPSVPMSFRATLYDLMTKSSREVFLEGEAYITGLGPGGGPIYPPPGGGQPPDHIWGGGNVPMPTPPIANVPGAPGYRPPGDHIWGPTDPRPTPPIQFPPGWVGGVPPLPPNVTPPEPPHPGDPTTPVPPPPGSGGWPTQDIVPPTYIIMNYPGIGPVVVAPPAQQPAGGTPAS